MDVALGLLIIALGSLGQSSSYVPIKRVKKWSWESFWLTQGIFAWLVFPLLGALLALPNDASILDIFSHEGSFLAIVYGVLWGIGGLTFGLSMRYLGVALGQSISLGTCAGFGTILPAIFSGMNLFEGRGLLLLLGVCITLAGIAIIGYAGSLRSKNMSEEEKQKAIKDFALKKGMLVAILAGVMSACFALGLDAANGIKEQMISSGVKPLIAGLPSILLVTAGGFVTNMVYCFYMNFKNKTFSDYKDSEVLINNILFCLLAGGLWYSQFFGLEIGKSFLTDSPVILAFSWSILMSLNVIFSNLWGVVLKEWSGCSTKTIVVLIAGMATLLFSVFLLSLI